MNFGQTFSLIKLIKVSFNFLFKFVKTKTRSVGSVGNDHTFQPDPVGPLQSESAARFKFKRKAVSS